MKKLAILIFVVAFLLTSINGLGQMTRRSAKTLAKGKFLFWTTSYYYDYGFKYNYTTGKWDKLNGDNLKTGINSMFVYAITDRWEAMINVPFTYSESTGSSGTKNCCGIGDIILQSRYSLLKGSKKVPYLTVTGAIRFPTGNKDTSPKLGDGTTDFALGFLLLSPRFGKFKGHIKLAYWLNGEDRNDINLGDQFEYLTKLDYDLTKKLMGFVALKGYLTSKNSDAVGNIIDCTEKNCFYIVPGAVWKPVKGLNIKPKLYIPVTGKGSKNYKIAPLVDLWVVF